MFVNVSRVQHGTNLLKLLKVDDLFERHSVATWELACTVEMPAPLYMTMKTWWCEPYKLLSYR